jgi:cobalt/nickel transport system permease protein
MHIPDGFLTPPVWGGLALASAPLVSLAARKAQQGAGESRAPLLGVMGAFVFAAQMINFPVGVGASGHLVGAALLTATVGPWAAAVVMTSILIIQALIFQDGGVAALGANVFNMALAGVAAAYLPLRFFSGQRLKIFLSGLLSVAAAAALAMAELMISGARIPAPTLSAAAVVFVINAVLEGLITVAVVQAIGRINKEWVRQDEVVSLPSRLVLASAAVVMAGAGFLIASAMPDGLERMLSDAGLQQASTGFSAPWVRRAAAGLLGLACTYVLCYTVGRALNRWRSA